MYRKGRKHSYRQEVSAIGATAAENKNQESMLELRQHTSKHSWVESTPGAKPDTDSKDRLSKTDADKQQQQQQQQQPQQPQQQNHKPTVLYKKERTRGSKTNLKC